MRLEARRQAGQRERPARKPDQVDSGDISCAQSHGSPRSLLAGAVQRRKIWPLPPLAVRPVGAPGAVPAMGEAVIVTFEVAVSITSYRVYRGTASGAETLLTAGGCSGLGAVLSCTDTRLTYGQTYFNKVSAVNAIGEGAQGNETSATGRRPVVGELRRYQRPPGRVDCDGPVARRF